ncbi:DeSI-like protein [Acorus calamus]|uniref:DeSI-like protein n=1 Tax=Acorus calamus TaxID=4465 RepID=A0AAV9FJM1_ACOCL|nr:DeSI-like protein [Acorus calamus]
MWSLMSSSREPNNGGGNARADLYLNVYDLTPINDYLYWFGFGIFHSGIEVAYIIVFKCSTKLNRFDGIEYLQEDVKGYGSFALHPPLLSLLTPSLESMLEPLQLKSYPGDFHHPEVP